MTTQNIPNTGGDTITNPVNANWQKTACSNVPPYFESERTHTEEFTEEFT